jgi:hypothetical protein
MSNVHFIGSLHPQAMEKEQDAKTEHVRGMHDSAYRGLGPIQRPRVLYLDNSVTARVVRAVLRLTNWRT